ncbi:SPX domain-containing protein [Phlebopus sp. FC_14]|nr:SPX domain-containing protein [Phlebopus sp. FC_14]
MKFARYLQDTQTPEWKKAYIDYRALKKQIGLIRAQQVEAASSTGTTDVNHTYKPATTHENGYQGNSMGGVGQSLDAHIPSKQGNTTSLRVPRPLEPIIDSPAVEKEEPIASRPPSVRRRNSRLRPSLSVKLNALPPHLAESSSAAPSQQTPPAPRTPYSPPVFPFFRDLGSTTPALHALLPQLPAIHARFFELLDAELDKIESFYAEREKEMRERGKRLREQLSELGIHRRKFYESTAHSTPGWVKKAHLPLPSALHALTDIYSRNNDAKDIDTPPVMASESGSGGQRGRGSLMELTPIAKSRRRSVGPSKKSKALDVDQQARSVSYVDGVTSPTAQDGLVSPPKTPAATSSKVASAAVRDGLDPLEYQHAKKRLKKAVVEFYRGLEVLNNYRILNLTGFRKALKKYEKITKIPAQAAYMKEKV